MRGVRHVACVAVVLVASASAWAAPPDVPVTLRAKPGQLVRVVVKADEGKLGSLRNFTDSEAFWGELVGPKGQRQFVFQAPTDGKRAQYVIGWWTAGETDGATTTIEIEGLTPPGPVPPAPPGPVPPAPNPPAPNPPAPDIDAALLAQFRTALADDIKAGAAKDKAAALADVYESGAELLTLNDPAIAPKTVGDLYSKCFAASLAKGVPRRPYLSKTRAVIESVIGGQDGTAQLTHHLRADFGAKFARVAAALKEASK